MNNVYIIIDDSRLNNEKAKVIAVYADKKTAIKATKEYAEKINRYNYLYKVTNDYDTSTVCTIFNKDRVDNPVYVYCMASEIK